MTYKFKFQGRKRLKPEEIKKGQIYLQRWYYTPENKIIRECVLIKKCSRDFSGSVVWGRRILWLTHLSCDYRTGNETSMDITDNEVKFYSLTKEEMDMVMVEEL